MARRIRLLKRATRPSFGMTIRAAEPHRLLREWEEFTTGHNRLAAVPPAVLGGRSILPDGRLVGGERRYDWSDVFLDAETEKTVRFHVQRLLASTADALRRLGVRPPIRLGAQQRGGLILAGAPGTGKTLIGKVLASVVERSFIWVTPAHLADARGVSELFGLVRLLAPVVLFVEDLDVLAEERGRNGGNVILGEIMNQLDGCHGDADVFAIATVPGLPGCWSQGATEKEALENIEDAIREYLAAVDELTQGSEVREVEVSV